jgi:hypothetical protein
MVSPDIERLLDALPPEPVDPRSSSQIVIDGYLLPGKSDSIRIVAGDLALEFNLLDVVEVTEIAVPAGVPTGLAVPVSLVLKRGAHLLECSPAAGYAPLLERVVQPFAYAARTSFPPGHVAPRFRSLEDAFRERHGLA